MKNTLDLIGRILIAAYFLYEAYDSIFFFKETKEKMSYFGLEWNQNILLILSIVLLLLGGILILTGYRTTLGATLLLLYFVPLTFVIHRFWSLPEDWQSITPYISDPKGFLRLQGILFMKNMAIIGGLFYVYINRSRKYSIRRLFATFRVRGT